MSLNKKGLVYLICDPSNDLFKIGVTRSTKEKRLKQLQTGNGTELIWRDEYETDFPYKIERILHRQFSYKREQGEWFALTTDDVLNFKESCSLIERNLKLQQDLSTYNCRAMN